MVLVSQGWNKVAEHVRRRREAMQQQNCRAILGTVYDGVLIRGHNEPPVRFGSIGDRKPSSATQASTASDALTDKRFHYRCYNRWRTESNELNQTNSKLRLEGRISLRRQPFGSRFYEHASSPEWRSD